MQLGTLALKSLNSRRFTLVLTVISIAVSVMLLLGVERIRSDMKSGFANTVSGTDLIVGARSGQLNLLLYSVFRLGSASNNVSWHSFERFSQHKAVEWAVPISLGDSHKGYRVVGTNSDYFQHRMYGNKQHLSLQQGQWFADEHQLVLGAEVASALGYALQDKVVLSHGVGNVSFSQHGNHPFTVAGILQTTGTPVDQSVFVSLEAIDAMHGIGTGHEGGEHHHHENHDAEHPSPVTAFYVGVKSKLQLLMLLREINEFEQEPLLAIIPGVALQELWGLLSGVEQGLMLLAAFVVFTGLLGMTTSILTSLNERRREMAVLRALGARPVHIFLLLLGESLLISVAGISLGLALFYALQWLGLPLIQQHLGIVLNITMLNTTEWQLLGLILGCGLLLSCIPAWRAYSQSLHDGIQIKT